MATAAQERGVDRESIFEQLRLEILDGSLHPGEALREVALATRFGVSRTPIREVLSRLEDAGLAVRKTRGLEVQSVDPQTVIQVYDMRILLEEEVAGQAALDRSMRDLLHLRALLDRDRALTDLSDPIVIRSNLEFHSAVWAASHNLVLHDLLTRLSSHLVHAPHSTLTVGNRWEEALEEHAALVAAIDDRDAARARAIARQHFTTARQIRLDLLQQMVADQELRPLDS